MEKPHKRLDAWKEAMTLVAEIYRVTGSFPPAEVYGLTSQMRRAALSVPSNIAEGAARGSRKEFANYLRMSRASLSELDTQVELGRRLGYVGGTDAGSLDALMERIDRMISGLIRKQARDA